MVSSKFSSKALEQKTPPHCKPCPPPSDVYIRPRTPLLYGYWYGQLPSWPDWFAYEFDALPMQILIPSRWFHFTQGQEAPQLNCTFTYQHSPGRWDMMANITPAPDVHRTATGTAPYPILKWEDDAIHVLVTPDEPTDSVDLFIVFS